VTDMGKALLIIIIEKGDCAEFMCSICPIKSTYPCISTTRRERAIQVFVEEFGQGELFEVLL